MSKIKRRCLQHRSHQHDKQPEPDGVLPSEPVTSPEGEDGTKEASNLIDSRDGSNGCGVGVVECALEAVASNETGEHSLIITKEQEC